MQLSGFFKNMTIQKRFTISVLVVVILVLSIFGGLRIISTADTLNADLNAKISTTSGLAMMAFSDPLWNYNYEGITATGDALFRDPEIGLVRLNTNIGREVYNQSSDGPAYGNECLMITERKIFRDNTFLGTLTMGVTTYYRDERLKNEMVAIAGSIIVLSLLLLLSLTYVSHVVTRPICELHRGTAEITRGNLEKRLTVDSQDEIGMLADKFNKMAESLQERILERKKAEDALRENEKFLDSIIENIPDMIFVKDAEELRFVRFNKAGERLLGFDRRDMYGKNDYDFFPKPEADFFTAKDREVLQNRNLVDIPTEPIDTKLKGKRILHTKKIPILNDSGDPRYLLGISEDITERRQAEDRLQESQRALSTLMSNLPGMAYRCRNDPSWTMEFVNQGCYDLTGYHDSELIHNRTVSYADLIHPDDCSMVWDSVQEGVQNHRPFRMVYRIHAADGSEKWVWEQGCGVFSDSGTLKALEGFILNITDRKLAEEESAKKSEELHAAYQQMTATAEELKSNYDELMRSQTALEQARRKLNLFNFITFTNIRSAMFALSGYLTLEKGFLADDRVLEFNKAETRLLDAVNNALDFAKTYQDLGIKPPCWQNVGQAFLYGISHLDIQHLSRSVEIKGLEIYADPLLEQVFFNLAQNVIRHSKTATEIHLSYYRTGNMIAIVFEDNGMGIPYSLKDTIFERSVEDRKGLGLFLTREILEITGIRIKETGETGKGARFEMLVPEGEWRIVSD